jgi:hypothetical protein
VNFAEVECLRNHWKLHSQLVADNTAVSRFSLGDYRPKAADRIVDYAIGLEFLFTPDAQGDIAYRLKIRGTHILGQLLSERSRSEIYEDLDYLYKWRSDIAHGRASKGRVKEILSSDDSQWDFVRQIRDYLRYTILFFYSEQLLESREKRIEHLQGKIDRQLVGIAES